MLTTVCDPLRTEIPLHTDPVLLGENRAFVLKHTRLQQDAVMQWLDWHWGSACAWPFGTSLLATLTRLAAVAIDEAVLPELLVPVRVGVERWLRFREDQDAPIAITWRYAQDVRARPSSTIALLLEPRSSPPSHR